jgi:hypothetical protein
MTGRSGTMHSDLQGNSPLSMLIDSAARNVNRVFTPARPLLPHAPEAVDSEMPLPARPPDTQSDGIFAGRHLFRNCDQQLIIKKTSPIKGATSKDVVSLETDLPLGVKEVDKDLPFRVQRTCLPDHAQPHSSRPSRDTAKLQEE